jgi:hypothetical protein
VAIGDGLWFVGAAAGAGTCGRGSSGLLLRTVGGSTRGGLVVVRGAQTENGPGER